MIPRKSRLYRLFLLFPLSPLLPIFFLLLLLFFSSSSSSSSSSWCRSFYLANCIRSLKPSLRTDAQSLGLKEAGEAKIEEEERGAGGMADGSLRGYRVVEKYPGGVLICARIL